MLTGFEVLAQPIRRSILDRLRERDHLVGELAGPLGFWLAEREPRWAFVRGAAEDVEAVWANGGRQERRALLERLRRTDPAAGRALLASTFAEETWEDREAFRSYMRSREHAASHSLEPADIMGRTEVRHEAYEVLMDSRRMPEWVA